MKKLLSLLLVVCMFATLLVSCGNKEKEPENTSETKSQELELTKINLEGQSARKVVYDYMYAMSQVKWTCDKNINLEEIHEGLTFRNKVQYTGLPYTTDVAANLEMFLSVVDENGKYTGPTDKRNCIGNHCSSSIIWSWRQVSDQITSTYTGSLMPNSNHGTIIVGDYKVGPNDKGCKEIINNNNLSVMCDAYSKLQMGDAILSFWPDKGTGHTRMVKEIHVEKTDSGVISAGKSYVVTLEQTNSFDNSNKKDITTWYVEHKYTFNDLYSALYIPITIPELNVETLPEINLRVSGFNTASNLLKGKLKGIIYSNYIIQGVTATVKDSEGNVIWTKDFATHPAELGKNTSGEGKNFTFANNDVEELRNLPDGDYEYRVSVKLAYGIQDVYAINFSSPEAAN